LTSSLFCVTIRGRKRRGKMPYKPIDTETKVKIIKEHFSGAKICSLAQKYKVNRDSIHLWINRVEDNLPHILTSKKPGPKPLREPEKDRLKKGLDSLQEQLNILSQLSHLTVSSRLLAEVRPSQCPECKGSHIVKNGTYVVRGERISRSLIIKQEGLIQRFRCQDCGASLYLVKKK